MLDMQYNLFGMHHLDSDFLKYLSSEIYAMKQTRVGCLSIRYKS